MRGEIIINESEMLFHKAVTHEEEIYELRI